MSLCVWVLGLSVFTWYYNCTTSRQAWCVGCCCSFLFLPVCEKKMFLVSVCEKLAKRERWVLTWEWTTPWDMWTASSLQNQSQTLENWVMNMILHFFGVKGTYEAVYEWSFGMIVSLTCLLYAQLHIMLLLPVIDWCCRVATWTTSSCGRLFRSELQQKCRRTKCQMLWHLCRYRIQFWYAWVLAVSVFWVLLINSFGAG